MELELTDEQKLVQKTAADFAKNEVLPKAAEIDRNHRHPKELVARMPSSAVSDMMEWGPARTPEEQYNLMLSHEISPKELIALSPEMPALDDDHPINEYNRLRTLFPEKMTGAAAGQ